MRTSTWNELDRLSKGLDRALVRLNKYNPNHDELGRFSSGPGGDSLTVSRGQKTEARAKAIAAYQRKFGHPPPKGMRTDAIRRWTKGPLQNAPRQNDTRTDEQVKRDVQERLAARSKEIAKQADIITNPSSSDTEKEKAGQELQNHAKDNWSDLQKLPDKIFYNPKLADELWETLKDPWTGIYALVLGPVTSGTTTALYGAAVALTATWLMGRWVYRKIATGGRYAGVKSASDRFWEDMKDWRKPAGLE